MSGVTIGLVIGAVALWPDPEIFSTDTFFIVALFSITLGAVHGVALGAVYGAIIGVITGTLVRTVAEQIHKLTNREKISIGVVVGAFTGAIVLNNFGEMINLFYGVYGGASIGALMGIPVGVTIAKISISRKK